MKKSFKRDATDLFITKQDEPVSVPVPVTDEGGSVPRGYRLVPDKRSERLQLLVSPSTKADLKELAQQEGVSVNDLVNRIMLEYIERANR